MKPRILYIYPEDLSIDFSTENMEFLLFHICKSGHWFSFTKYAFFYIWHMKILAQI